jgi:hypothetical protein
MWYFRGEVIVGGAAFRSANCVPAVRGMTQRRYLDIRNIEGALHVSFARCLSENIGLDIYRKKLRLRLLAKLRKFGWDKPRLDGACIILDDSEKVGRGLTGEEIAELDRSIDAIAHRDWPPRVVEKALGITNRERLRWTKDGRLRRVNAASIMRGNRVSISLYSARQIAELVSNRQIIEAWRAEDADMENSQNKIAYPNSCQLLP